MITAAITAGVAAILALFGIEPTAKQLVLVAIVVKVILVLLGLLFGVRLAMRKRDPAASGADVSPPRDPGR